MNKPVHFFSILFFFMLMPQLAFADIAPMPEMSCMDCAVYCVGCCGEKPTGGYICRECQYIQCDYESVCYASEPCKVRRAAEEAARQEELARQDQQQHHAKASAPETDTSKVATRPQERSCTALPLSSGTQNWLLLFILMATVCMISFSAAYRLSRK